MNKTLLALAAAASMAAAAVSVPGTAQAGCFGCAVGAGVFGGLVAGTIIGSAAAASAPPPGYYGPGPYGPPGPGCYYTRRPVWDPYMGAYRPGPRVLVCP